ncbi:MAG: AAA family ATPase [Candidatus Thermoplasmatota archaeon]
MFEYRPSRIFKDPAKLSFDYVPDTLVHREKELKRLYAMFQQVVSHGLAQRALITGSVGTGKTVLSKRFCMDFKGYGGSKGKVLDFVHVNCRQRSTENAVLLRILSHYDPRFPDRGFSTQEMLQILRARLEKEGIHLIVVLDEVDVLLKKSGADLVYALSRFDEERLSPKGNLSLIMISQKGVLDLLDPAALSTFKRSNVIDLGRYTQGELVDILAARVELALQPGTISSDAVEMIADIASEWGDARYAIEILEKSGTLADESGMGEIGPEHVRAAKAETYSVVSTGKLQPLPTHERCVLLAAARLLRKEAYVTTGEVESAYAVVCEEYGEKSRGHTQFWSYLKNLSANGLIDTKPSGKGTAGKTTLISILDIPAGELAEQLERMLRAAP